METFLRERSPEAFAAVVDEHLELIRKMTYRIVMNAHDVDDVIQETFLAAHRSVASFNGQSKFSTWLCRIARNKAYKVVTRRRKRIELDGKALGAAVESRTPEYYLNVREANGRINASLHELTEPLRETFLLVFLDEKPIGEAAKILGCPKATVYWRLHKAKKILRRNLRDHE